MRRESAVWERAAREIRTLGKDIEADVEHSDELKTVIETGSRPTFVSMMAAAFPDRVATKIPLAIRPTSVA